MKASIKLWGVVVLLLGLSFLGVSCQTFAAPYTFKGTLLEPPQPIPDFELLTTEGKPFHFSDKAGDITLVYFGYTFCPDVCPLTLADVKRALSELKEKQDRVHVVFISVDPERDTPEVLGRYLAAFDPTFIGLTGDPTKLEEAKAAFGVFSQKEQTEDSAAGYLVSHTSRLFLLNPQGALTLLYSFDFPYEDLRSDLEHLLDEL